MAEGEYIVTARTPSMRGLGFYVLHSKKLAEDWAASIRSGGGEASVRPKSSESSVAPERKWSRGITLKHGGLGHWNHEDEPETRRGQLAQARKRADSWETIRKRLQIIANLSKHGNPELGQAAEADARWIDRTKE